MSGGLAMLRAYSAFCLRITVVLKGSYDAGVKPGSATCKASITIPSPDFPSSVHPSGNPDTSTYKT